MPAPDARRHRLLVAATAVATLAFGLYVAAFWPTLVGEASNACEGLEFDRTAWPPSGNCGDAPWRRFDWSWADEAILTLAGIAALLAAVSFARRA